MPATIADISFLAEPVRALVAAMPLIDSLAFIAVCAVTSFKRFAASNKAGTITLAIPVPNIIIVPNKAVGEADRTATKGIKTTLRILSKPVDISVKVAASLSKGLASTDFANAPNLPSPSSRTAFINACLFSVKVSAETNFSFS